MERELVMHKMPHSYVVGEWKWLLKPKHSQEQSGAHVIRESKDFPTRVDIRNRCQTAPICDEFYVGKQKIVTKILHIRHQFA